MILSYSRILFHLNIFWTSLGIFTKFCINLDIFSSPGLKSPGEPLVDRLAIINGFELFYLCRLKVNLNLIWSMTCLRWGNSDISFQAKCNGNLVAMTSWYRYLIIITTLILSDLSEKYIDYGYTKIMNKFLNELGPVS